MHVRKHADKLVFLKYLVLMRCKKHVHTLSIHLPLRVTLTTALFSRQQLLRSSQRRFVSWGLVGGKMQVCAANARGGGKTRAVRAVATEPQGEELFRWLQA